jgi:hypothetical protein
MRTILLAALFGFGSAAIAAEPSLVSPRFDWPASQPGAIADLRVKNAVTQAEESARRAETRAYEGRRAAAHARRRDKVRGVLGMRPHRAIIDDDTEMAGTRYEDGVLGSISYPSGATMTGLFGEDLGAYTGGPESALDRFSGWVWGAQTDHPSCTDGIFEWKNGDTFTGSVTGKGGDIYGVYLEAGGQRRFIGELDMSEASWHPLRGYVLDAKGRLLAVVRRE